MSRRVVDQIAEFPALDFGEPLDGHRHVWWNFVSSSRERIQEAKRAWMAREFPVVPGDEIEWIPIPGEPKTVSYP